MSQAYRVSGKVTTAVLIDRFGEGGKGVFNLYAKRGYRLALSLTSG